MTSLGANKILESQGFNTCFKVQGQVYHLLGTLDAQNNQQPNYLQMYFMGNTEDEVRQRIEHLLSANLNNNIISVLKNMLHYHNT